MPLVFVCCPFPVLVSPSEYCIVLIVTAPLVVTASPCSQGPWEHVLQLEFICHFSHEKTRLVDLGLNKHTSELLFS